MIRPSDLLEAVAEFLGQTSFQGTLKLRSHGTISRGPVYEARPNEPPSGRVPSPPWQQRAFSVQSFRQRFPDHVVRIEVASPEGVWLVFTPKGQFGPRPNLRDGEPFFLAVYFSAKSEDEVQPEPTLGSTFWERLRKDD